MKTRLIFICFLTVLLSSCNIPSGSQPTVDIVATQVAKFLDETAKASPLIESKTLTASEQATDIPDLETETTPTLAPTNTATQTQTPTLSPTQTPTENLSDPALSLGNPTWVDDFSTSGSKWDYQDQDNYFSLKVKDGYLYITSTSQPYWNSWYVTYPKIQDFYLEMTFDMPNCSGADRIGLAFRAPDVNQFYFFGITCDGKWGFEKYTAENKIVNIIPYTVSNELIPSNQMNRVGIKTSGNQFDFYINGSKVGQTSDNSFLDAGYFGFIIRYIETFGFTSRIDNIQYWQLP